jgi:hypothetical protein
VSIQLPLLRLDWCFVQLRVFERKWHFQPKQIAPPPRLQQMEFIASSPVKNASILTEIRSCDLPWSLKQTNRRNQNMGPKDQSFNFQWKQTAPPPRLQRMGCMTRIPVKNASVVTKIRSCDLPWSLKQANRRN